MAICGVCTFTDLFLPNVDIGCVQAIIFFTLKLKCLNVLYIRQSRKQTLNNNYHFSDLLLNSYNINYNGRTFSINDTIKEVGLIWYRGRGC